MNFKSLATVLFTCAAVSVQAGFTKSVVLDSSYDATQPLQDGTVYIVEESQSSVGKYDGKSVSSVVLGVPLADCIAATDLPKVAPRFGKEFLGWFTEENGAGTKWFNADGTWADTAPELYETVGSTTLHAAWRDMQGFKAEDYKLEPAGITVDGTSLVIPVGIENAANLDYALQFMKVRASTSLPISAYAPFENVEVETREGGVKAIVIPIKPNAPSKFYRIVVGE